MTIHRLRPDELVRIDTGSIRAIRSAIGASRADYIFDMILHDLLESLVAAEEALAADRRSDVSKAASRIATQADRLSLGDLKARAEAVQQLAVHADEPSLPAVVHRMIRTGEASVSSVWSALTPQARS